MRRLVLAGICAIAIVGTSSTAALAGEVNGKGQPTAGPDHANSICVFSGQNDDPNAPIVSAFPIPAAPNGPGGRTLNYGQDVRYGLLSPSIVTPGQTCRGGSNPERG